MRTLKRIEGMGGGVPKDPDPAYLITDGKEEYQVTAAELDQILSWPTPGEIFHRLTREALRRHRALTLREIEMVRDELCPEFRPFRKGDVVSVQGETEPGKPHPQAGRRGEITEVWLTVPRLTLRLNDGGRNDGNFIFISPIYAKLVTPAREEGRGE